MTALEVVDVMGKPEKQLTFGSTEKWIYPDLTVLLENRQGQGRRVLIRSGTDAAEPLGPATESRVLMFHGLDDQALLPGASTTPGVCSRRTSPSSPSREPATSSARRQRPRDEDHEVVAADRDSDRLAGR